MNKLLTIIKAKISDKSDLGDWYKDRLRICMGCEFNSENKEKLTIKDKLKVAANLGEPTCLACGCEIAAKASIEIENCGMVEKGLPSKWIRINLNAPDKMEVINESPDKVSMTKGLNNTYVFNYNTIPKGFDSEIVLRITKKGLNVKKLAKASTCGCTVPNATQDENGDIIYKIVYNTQTKGKFSKTVTLTVQEENETITKFFFTIEGDVK